MKWTEKKERWIGESVLDDYEGDGRESRFRKKPETATYNSSRYIRRIDSAV